MSARRAVAGNVIVPLCTPCKSRQQSRHVDDLGVAPQDDPEARHLRERAHREEPQRGDPRAARRERLTASGFRSVASRRCSSWPLPSGSSHTCAGRETFACGIGPVEAALQTARVLAERRPDAVLHVGIAGARGIDPPALVLGSESVYCDVVDPSSLLQRIERIEPDAAFFARVHAALPDALVAADRDGGHGRRRHGVRRGGDGRASACCARARSRACRRSSCARSRTRPTRPTVGAWSFEDAFVALGDAVARVLAV